MAGVGASLPWLKVAESPQRREKRCQLSRGYGGSRASEQSPAAASWAWASGRAAKPLELSSGLLLAAS